MLTRYSPTLLSEVICRQQSSVSLVACSIDVRSDVHVNKSTATHKTDKASRKQIVLQSSRLSGSASSDRSPQQATSRRGRTGGDLWAAVAETALQEALRSSRGLIASTEQALARVNRLLAPLPDDFPAGEIQSFCREECVPDRIPQLIAMNMMQKFLALKSISRRLLGMHGTGPGGDVVLDFLRSPLGFLDRIVRQHGGSVGLRLGGEHVVLLTDPALSRQVLIDQADTFCKVTQP